MISSCVQTVTKTCHELQTKNFVDWSSEQMAKTNKEILVSHRFN
jgi:hypothetical protein